jgi:hypothetical protein
MSEREHDSQCEINPWRHYCHCRERALEAQLENSYSHEYFAEVVDGLKAQLAACRAALKLLVTDVQDYEAWQRPCYALDVARAALAEGP